MDQPATNSCRQYKQILVPIDGSENSCRAIAAAVDIGRIISGDNQYFIYPDLFTANFVAKINLWR